jgi:hypothetical protein
MNILNGLSHGIIFFNTHDREKKTGIAAMIKLCFGSDDDCISQVFYYKPKGKNLYEWVLPSRISEESSLIHPIFTGQVEREVLQATGIVADRFKAFYKDTDTSKYGRKWRVTKVGIEEIITEVKAAQP